MLDLNNVYAELLENTIFVQLQIIENMENIKYIHDTLYLNTSLEGLKDLSASSDLVRMEFYNNLVQNYQDKVLNKNIRAYELLREYRLNFLIKKNSVEELIFWYENCSIEVQNGIDITATKFNESSFYKAITVKSPEPDGANQTLVNEESKINEASQATQLTEESKQKNLNPPTEKESTN